MRKEMGRHQRGSKSLALLLACVLLIGGVVGGTVAWLTAESDTVTNTFSTSDIGVELKESENLDLQMIPGWNITKDPKAWITDGSEDAFLFVKVEKSANFDTFMEEIVIADGWTKLEDGVYYRKVTTDKQGEDNAFPILKDNKVTVKGEVTKEQMKALTDATLPTLTFTAYAHQLYEREGVEFTAAKAWENLNTPATP